MRLLHRVLPMVPKTNQPQRTFVAHLVRLLLLLPGHATFRHFSRDRRYHDKTWARQFAQPFDFVALNKAAMVTVVPADQEHALALDASGIAKSGKRTYGLDRFWNSCHGRAERGGAISVLGWVDITHTSAYGVRVEPTPPSRAAAPAATRLDTSLEQLRRVVPQYHLQPLQDGRTDGAFSKVTFMEGVCDLTLHHMGKLRCDAHLRSLYTGPQCPGPGRPKTYDGKVRWPALSRCERAETSDAGIILYAQGLPHGQSSAIGAWAKSSIPPPTVRRCS
jgi:DDE superfamily endonuclease